MTITVDIGGGQIVEFPDEQTAELFMASRLAGQEAPEFSQARDMLESLRGGAITGLGTVLDLPSTVGRAGGALIERGVQALGLGPTGFTEAAAAAPQQGFIDAVSEVAPSVGEMAAYEPQTVAGEYAQTIGEFLPGAALTPGGPLARIGLGAIAPAVSSETAGRAAEALGAGPTGQMIAEIGGAVVGPAMAERAVRRLVSPLGGADPLRTAAAQTLREADVPVTAGQRTGSAFLQRIEDATEASPEQLEAFTTAAMRSIGSEATRATDDALNEAASRIGSVFDDVARGVDVTPTQGSAQRFASIANAYRETAPTAARAPIVDSIADAIQDAAERGRNISADTVMTWRSRLSRLTRTPDAATRETAVEALEAVDDILKDSLTAAGRADDVARLRTARSQWRDYLAIERAAGQAGEGSALGLLSPQALRGALQAQSRSQFVRGQRGELGDLTRSAQAVLSPAPSVLPAGVRAVEGAGRAAMAGVGGTIGGIPGAAAGFFAPELFRLGATSRPMQAYLGNQLLGAAPPRLTAAQRLMLYGPLAGQD